MSRHNNEQSHEAPVHSHNVKRKVVRETKSSEKSEGKKHESKESKSFEKKEHGGMKMKRKSAKHEKRKIGEIKHTGKFEGKSNRLGGGGRFAQVEAKARAGGAKNPAAVAAIAGRKSLGKAKFQKLAAAGKKRNAKGKK